MWDHVFVVAIESKKPCTWWTFIGAPYLFWIQSSFLQVLHQNLDISFQLLQNGGPVHPFT